MQPTNQVVGRDFKKTSMSSSSVSFVTFTSVFHSGYNSAGSPGLWISSIWVLSADLSDVSYFTLSHCNVSSSRRWCSPLSSSSLLVSSSSSSSSHHLSSSPRLVRSSASFFSYSCLSSCTCCFQYPIHGQVSFGLCTCGLLSVAYSWPCSHKIRSCNDWISLFSIWSHRCHKMR